MPFITIGARRAAFVTAGKRKSAEKWGKRRFGAPPRALPRPQARFPRPEKICLVDRCLKEGAPMDECKSRLRAACASQAGLHCMTTAYGFGIAPLDPALLRRALPHVIHVHGKF